ncbi:MAG: MopE-related protein [Flavobacteriales bacterium]|nr:MopE-related protein [Flavobacteriales bacterium]
MRQINSSAFVCSALTGVLALLFAMTGPVVSAQEITENTSFTGLSYELIQANSLPDNFHTYRVYANFTDEGEALQAIFANSVGLLGSSMRVVPTGSFYQHPFGTLLATGVNPALISGFPELAYDSWFTIDYEDAIDNETSNTGSTPWHLQGVNFEDGGSFEVVDDPVGGTFYTTTLTFVQGLPDENGRVLMGQFTTDGFVTVELNLQTRIVETEGVGLVYNTTLTFPDELLGCTDISACNYNSDATVDDGSCVFEQMYFVDNDGDGYGTDVTYACEFGPGLAMVGGDCNDFNPDAHPGADEIPGDGIDGNCDGQELCFRDVDNDGYRSSDTTDLVLSAFNVNCSEIGEAYIFQPIDCSDENPALFILDGNGVCIGDDAFNERCADPSACNYDPEAFAEENNCDYVSCADCGNEGACNYNPDALIVNPALCEYTSCSGCTDPEATNYDSTVMIADDSDCIYTAIFSFSRTSINAYDEGGVPGTYTGEIYALMPPGTIQLEKVLGTSDIALSFSTFSSLHQADSGAWEPSALQHTVEVDGVTYTDVNLRADSWFTIGGTFGDGLQVTPIGFSGDTIESIDSFNFGLTAMAVGDTVGWRIETGAIQGVPVDACDVLQDRPGCVRAIRVAQVTLPMDSGFVFEAGIQYRVASVGERVVDDSVTDEGSLEVGGGGAGDDAEDYTDGETYTNNGCTDSGACNYDPEATDDNGTCEFSTCAGCTYTEGENYDSEATLDDGTCTFTLGGGDCPSDLNGDGLVGAPDLLEFLSAFDSVCE